MDEWGTDKHTHSLRLNRKKGGSFVPILRKKWAISGRTGVFFVNDEIEHSNNRKTHCYINKGLSIGHRWMDDRIDGWMDGWMDG